MKGTLGGLKDGKGGDDCWNERKALNKFILVPRNAGRLQGLISTALQPYRRQPAKQNETPLPRARFPMDNIPEYSKWVTTLKAETWISK